MPRLPDVQDFGARPIPQSSSPIVGIGGGAMDGMADAGRALRSTAERIDARRQNFEIAKAKSRVLQTSITAESEVQNGDWRTWDKAYSERMEKSIAEAASLISDSRERELFQMEGQTALLRGRERLTGLAKGREADEGRASLNELISSNLDAAMGLDDEAGRTALIDNISDAITAAHDNEFITAQEAQSLRRQAHQNYVTRRLSMMSDAERLGAVGGGRGRLSPDMEAMIADAGGDDADTLITIAALESGGDPGAVNADSGAAGLFQFVPSTARQYGLQNPLDAKASAQAAAELLRANRASLQRSLGRDPEPWELYLAHQQGAGGAAALLADPGRNAVDVLTDVYGGDRARATRAVTQNGGTTSMSANGFARLWQKKFGVASGQVGGTPSLAQYIPEDQRMQIAAEAMDGIARQEVVDRQRAAQASQEIAAALTAAQDVAAFDTWKRVYLGERVPPEEIIDRVNDRTLDPDDGRALLEATTVTPATADMPGLQLGIMAAQNNGQSTARLIAQEFTNGNLTEATAEKLLARDQTFAGDTRPGPEFDRHRTRLERSLNIDPEGLAAINPMLIVGTQERTQEALLEYDDRVLAGESAREVASDLIDRGRLRPQDMDFAAENRFNSLVMPRIGITKDGKPASYRGEIDINASRSANDADLDAGRIDEDTWLREDRLLDQYESIAGSAMSMPQLNIPGR